jgi:O-antigen ligase
LISKFSEWDKYLLGTALFVSLLIGGGTATGLYTDTVIEVVTIVAAAAVFSRPSEQRIPLPALWLLIFAFALFVFQIAPLPSTIFNGLRPHPLLGLPELPGETRFRFVSVGVGRTIECLFFLLAAAAFFLSVMRLRAEQVYGLLPFFFMGVICNGLAGIIQYSLSDNIAIDGLLPFTINAGLFANQNHFATLLFVSIPFGVYFGLFRGHLVSSFLGLAALLLLLLAVGSRAGILIGLAITVISIAFLSVRTRFSGFGVLAVFLGLSIYTIGAWTKIESRDVDPSFGRGEFARTTIEAIKDNWVTGIGFGNFQKVYQIYERKVMIFSEYVNHAHNDYFELVLEGGLAVALVLLAYFLMIVVSVIRLRMLVFQKAALLSVIFILIHSMVDYPFRTMALSIVFAYLNAVIFHRGFYRELEQRNDVLEVNHNGEKLFVPIDRKS